MEALSLTISSISLILITLWQRTTLQSSTNFCKKISMPRNLVFKDLNPKFTNEAGLTKVKSWTSKRKIFIIKYAILSKLQMRSQWRQNSLKIANKLKKNKLSSKMKNLRFQILVAQNRLRHAMQSQSERWFKKERTCQPRNKLIRLKLRLAKASLCREKKEKRKIPIKIWQTKRLSMTNSILDRSHRRK